jgi:hypothetical protein
VQHHPDASVERNGSHRISPGDILFEMKVLAIIDVATGAHFDEIRPKLAEELRGSWALFASGVLREAYATSVPTRVVFVLEVGDVASAEAHLHTLPLIATGLLSVQLVELRPFANWAVLFSPT